MEGRGEAERGKEGRPRERWTWEGREGVKAQDL